MSTYTAKFARLDITLFHNAGDVSLSPVETTVDLASIETGYPCDGGRDFDAEFHGPYFFNTALFPKATFSSKSVASASPRTLTVSGQLIRLGVSLSMAL